jgi:hypothetical protein
MFSENVLAKEKLIEERAAKQITTYCELDEKKQQEKLKQD